MLDLAQSHAQASNFQGMRATCAQVTDQFCDNASALLDAGALLLNFGLVSDARQCFERCLTLSPSDMRATLNLANCARDSGKHREANELYLELQNQQPDNAMVRRNVLVTQQYNPEMTDNERLAYATAWGWWAVARAGGPRPRPGMRADFGNASSDSPNRASSHRLKVGYVSADLCQHTVGLFVKGVLKAHQQHAFNSGSPHPVEVYAYSSGQVSDWVTKEVGSYCTLREVAGLDDAQLANLIRQDCIDVLVDLSGHTAGSRLTMFAHRPAPVQVSWLGYFATTGLQSIDAVLLDEWHAPEPAQAQFVEEVVRLNGGRLCYEPVPWAPAVAPLPCMKAGRITFGSFNNTGKLNPAVLDAWSSVLAAVPNSRLVLKWRTLVDEPLCESIREGFRGRGVDPERVELRPASFHVDVLHEYADIDIALDPFPFTGGLTSCEALWMGVPVVTMPQESVVSRQTFALLSAIGKTEWVAKDIADYIKIATELSADKDKLARTRATLRDAMGSSCLMDVSGFTRHLEQAYYEIYKKIKMQESTTSTPLKTVLHVGPGHKNSGAKLPEGFEEGDWHELRLDIDPSNEPDILGSMLDMSAVASRSVDAIYSAHNIEHVYAHEVPHVLAEFLRVLKPEGFVVVTCPDLQAVCAMVAEGRITEPAYNSKAGPITPLDILYGHGEALKAGYHYMAHKTGFTEGSLTQALTGAGFACVASKRRPHGLDLWALATKGGMTREVLTGLAGRLLPK